MNQVSSSKTHALAHSHTRPGYSRSPQSSLDIVEPELVDALSRVSEQLDSIVEQSLNDATPAQALAEKLSAQLGEVAGVFSMLNLSVAANLSGQLGLAVEKVCNTQRPIEEREYQALFQSAYLLPRFFEYVQATGVTSPLLLAPCFYSLASAGLAPFVLESELIEFAYKAKNESNNNSAENNLLEPPVQDAVDEIAVELPVDLPAEPLELSLEPLESELDLTADFIPEPSQSVADESKAVLGSGAVAVVDEELLKTFRRLRQMYQTGLIGMLRDDEVSAKLKLLNRVAERCINLCADSPSAMVWRLLKRYIDAVEQSQLELTPQRRHFFARFDRSLKVLIKDPEQGLQTLPDSSVLAELTLLLLLADSNNANDSDLVALGEFDSMAWTDKAIVEHRESMERSTHKALLTMLEVIREELGGGKRILDMISESGMCEGDDVDTLLENCRRISAVLKIGGFIDATDAIDESIESISQWRGSAPDQEALLDAANMMLYIENALLTGSLIDGEENLDKNSTVAKGLLQQAQLDLYEESKANIGMAKRALTSYLESNFDREHIANVAVGLESIGGAFNMVDVSNAEALMQRSAVLIREEYNNSGDSDIAVLENLADALVSIEYLLDELSSGRGIDAGVAKLVDESLLALA